MAEGEPRRLLVRGFPYCLAGREKESLLQHFGATEVVTMPTKGKMRNCVFASFASHEDAKRALSRLHQLRVLRCRLVVEYVQDKHSPLLQDTLQDSNEVEAEDCHEDKSPSPKPPSPKHPPPPASLRLSYHYPPPSSSTLTNITHTLASVPKFYVQVLHLMNMMNLPPPFGPPTPAPLLVGGEDGEVSEVESEVGSEGEGRGHDPARATRPRREVKRRAAHLRPSRGASPPAKKRRPSASEPQFELPPPLQAAKRIELHVPSEIKPRPPDHTYQTTSIATTSDSVAAVGRLPVLAAGSDTQSDREASEQRKEEDEEAGGGEKEEEADEGEEWPKFISSEELARNRLSKQEMRDVGVFHNYSAGEPSLRLYIKNLARHVTEQDLCYIYARYIDWSSDRERNIFDVRLMQAGRMKGQAFVGLPSEEAAAAALRETNGYQLAGRPMVVHFARTAKAKPSPANS